jgi:sarcosine oxidase/L-pipecolate oxidase
MKNINPHKANDIYKIKPAIIKDLSDFLPPILTPLFNQSIDDNTYPDSLKYTKLIELYKSGNTEYPINYRPISLLPIIAKLLDTIINNQLMDYLLEHNLISPTQYAFRPNSNTTMALKTILNNIHHRKSKHPTLAIYIDLSKAYDTVSHPKLIQKLQDEFNFSPETVTYFSSYFQNRQQSTHTQHAESKTQTITHGIPQGSTLSTTLFLLYINNIIHTVPNSKVYTYADDTTLVITAETMEELQQHAQANLDKLVHYFHSLNLVPNATKTNFTLFTNPPSGTLPLELTMPDGLHDPNLEQTNSAKLLGIYVQSTLKHHNTIANVVRKLQHTIRQFRYAATLLPKKYMIQLYYTHAYPHLIGDISIWGTQNINQDYILPLVRTHK